MSVAIGSPADHRMWFDAGNQSGKVRLDLGPKRVPNRAHAWRQYGVAKSLGDLNLMREL